MILNNLLRHLLPAFVGVGVGYPSALMLIRLDRPLRFAGAALVVLGLWYLLARINYFNHRLDVEERARAAGLLPNKSSLAGALPHWPLLGYAAMLASALAISFGFAYDWQLPLTIVACGVLWWWGDNQFTKTNTAFLRECLEAIVSPEPAPAGPAKVSIKEKGKLQPVTQPAAPFDEAAAKNAALMRAIEEKRQNDPLIGAKIGAKELNQRLLIAMKGERGVHTESLLSTLGALAGYACQVSLRSEALSRGDNANSPFKVVQDKQGRRYFFGDALNQRLAEGQYSVWNVATSGLCKDGLQSLPDLHPIFKHVSETVGSEQFGIPRFPEGHNASDLPINYVKGLWPVVMPLLKQYSRKPEEWPVLFGFALQEVLRMSKDVLAPELALQVVMESAVPMSKVDLQTA